MKNIIYFKKTILIMLTISFLSCTKENHLSDLDSCAQLEKKEFNHLNTFKTDRLYDPANVFNTENYVLYYGNVGSSPDKGWITINKETNEIRNTLSDKKEYNNFAPGKDKVYFTSDNFKVHIFNALDNTITSLPLGSYPHLKYFADLKVFENDLYILGYKKNLLQVIKYDLETGHEETIKTIDKINGHSISGFHTLDFHVYKNPDNIICLLIILDTGYDILLYSIQINSGNQEYFHILDGYLERLEFVDQVNNVPLIEINNWPAKTIFNYRDNILQEYTENETLSGQYILSKSGWIRDVLTGQIVKTFSPPLVYDFKPLFYDPAINGLFCAHSHNFKLLDLATNCIQGQGLERYFKTYIDPERKKIYELYYAGGKENEISVYSYAGF